MSSDSEFHLGKKKKSELELLGTFWKTTTKNKVENQNTHIVTESGILPAEYVPKLMEQVPMILRGYQKSAFHPSWLKKKQEMM